MKQEPRSAIQMEKQLGWVSKLGGVESGISKVGQTVLARLMESQLRQQLACSVRGEFKKGTMSSACLDATHFSFSLCATGAFKLLPWCWSSEGVSLSK